MNLVFTICSNNYLAQAIFLGQTLSKHNPSYDFKICLVDKKSNKINYNKFPYEIIEVEQIGIKEFSDMVLRYNIVELNTSVKPFLFQFFFSTGKYDKIIYLDPDIEIFNPFTEIEYQFIENDIIITPHFFSPLNDNEWQAEEDFLNAGVYNLGFIGIKYTPNSLKMLDWWAERLKTKAHINFCKGMFTDQIWITFVPLFFEKVCILKHLGHNVAYWNLHEREILFNEGQYYVDINTPLVFYHYASYRPLNPKQISTGQRRYTFESRPDIKPLFDNYNEKLFEIGYREMNSIKCVYIEPKEELEKKTYQEKVKKYPIYKKVLGKFVRFMINKFNLTLDYRNL